MAKVRFQQFPNLKIRSLLKIKERVFQAGELLPGTESDAGILERNGGIPLQEGDALQQPVPRHGDCARLQAVAPCAGGKDEGRANHAAGGERDQPSTGAGVRCSCTSHRHWCVCAKTA